jgi:trimeric autotransporter adhesin
LRPVTFHYKSDKQGAPQFGLIAEEVAKVNPNLVVRDDSGQVYTVRYDAVNAMLLNEFLKEHRKVEELERQIEMLTAAVQKVSQQIETDRTAGQLAAKG